MMPLYIEFCHWLSGERASLQAFWLMQTNVVWRTPLQRVLIDLSVGVTRMVHACPAQPQASVPGTVPNRSDKGLSSSHAWSTTVSLSPCCSCFSPFPFCHSVCRAPLSPRPHRHAEMAMAYPPTAAAGVQVASSRTKEGNSCLRTRAAILASVPKEVPSSNKGVEHQGLPAA
jgi:hypothetical protein